MKIAVTGAGGFIGARLIETFQLAEGPTLAAVARHPAELTLPARFAVDLRLADYLNADSLARSFAGCSAVVHLAPFAAGDARRATVALCRAAAQTAVKRIVLVGSADLHGLSPAPGTTEKSSPPTAGPGSETAAALAVAERALFSECRQLGLAAYALRPGFLYGPRVPAFAHLAAELQDERAWLLRQGEGICNGLYLDNLITAIRLALKTKSGAGSAFLLTDAETLTWRDFYQAAAEELNVSNNTLRFIDTPPPAASAGFSAEFAARQLCACKLPIARAARELGYEPPVPFAEAMRRTCAWWRFAHGEFTAAA